VKKLRPPRPTRLSPSSATGAAASSAELTGLRARLAAAEETLRAFTAGEVDSVMIPGRRGPQMFTLAGADDAYRGLIESMNEGALTLTAAGVILYANRRFSAMIGDSLERVIGSSFHRFLSAADQAALSPLLHQRAKAGSKLQLRLTVVDGSALPVQLSLRPVAKTGAGRAAIGMVVTDLSEARRNEELLRALTHRVVQVQEAERRHVALELHDNITQLLCAVLFRSQALADSLSARQGPAKREANALRELLGQTAEEVERISRNLRPSVLEHLGLVAALEGARAEFVSRTGLVFELTCEESAAPLPFDTKMALFRIVQEALKNVEQHARASRVTVALTHREAGVQLSIRDDGIGFESAPASLLASGKLGLGLLGMRERASYVGGTLRVRSALRAGTEIEVSIPRAMDAAALV